MKKITLIIFMSLAMLIAMPKAFSQELGGGEIDLEFIATTSLGLLVDQLEKNNDDRQVILWRMTNIVKIETRLSGDIHAKYELGNLSRFDSLETIEIFKDLDYLFNKESKKYAKKVLQIKKLEVAIVQKVDMWKEEIPNPSQKILRYMFYVLEYVSGVTDEDAKAQDLRYIRLFNKNNHWARE